jgi:glycosyltransferase involved in cell wall biosynthesis
MKILILTMNVGRTAPGKVFERLILGLSKYHEVEVVTGDFDPDISWVDSTVRFYQISNIKIHPRIEKLFISYLSFNPFDFYWTHQVVNHIKTRESNNYDIVFSFVSFGHYAGLVAGLKLSKICKCKHIAYIVDAIPAPIEWLNSNFYYNGLKKMMCRYMSQLDAVFSSNKQMLDYQTAMLDNNSITTGVIYNPGMELFTEYPVTNCDDNVFVFTGGIYGPRKPDFVINAFVKLLAIHPNSKLIFVGTPQSEKALSLPIARIDYRDRSKIEIHPFTKDLTQYYTMATALIDIDSYLDNDIFVSSKMTNYINVNRIIISETGVNSPSRQIFKGIDSILQCGHDSDEIFQAMLKVVQLQNKISYGDRLKVQKSFSLNEVIKNLNVSLNNIGPE